MKVKILALTIVALSSIVACRRDKPEVFDNAFASDNSMAENLFNDVYKVVEDVSSQTEGIREDGIGCIDTIIVDTTSSPRTVMIDFGTDDCVGEDGRIRKGVLNITYTGRYRDEGTVITVTPENYTVNGHQVNGTKTITNLGTNDLGQYHFNISVTGSITAPAGLWTASWNSTRTRTWVSGYNTLALIDDVYEIEGSASGINRYGNAYQLQITTPLRAELVCPWLVSGVLNITPENEDTRTVNFGSGDCNNGFTVTVNGETETFNGGN